MAELEVTKEDLIDFLNKVRAIKEIAPQVLVGAATMEQLAAAQPETWNDVMYLITEWDYSYLTKAQLEEAILNFKNDLLSPPEEA